MTQALVGLVGSLAFKWEAGSCSSASVLYSPLSSCRRWTGGWSRSGSPPTQTASHAMETLLRVQGHVVPGEEGAPTLTPWKVQDGSHENWSCGHGAEAGPEEQGSPFLSTTGQPPR